MIRAAASFTRGKPLTARRSSLKARGALSEADQLSFFNSLLYLIYKAACSLLESEQLCCVQSVESVGECLGALSASCG